MSEVTMVLQAIGRGQRQASDELLSLYTGTTIVDANNSGATNSFASGVLTLVSLTAINPTNITFSVSGSTLALSWPADHSGSILQAQTNDAGISNNWSDVPGSSSSTQALTSISFSNPTVFFPLL